MGKYFLMSVRFNKSDAYDFGLVPSDNDTAINPRDNSTWIKAHLYDFGWGKENGYYKYPLPDFDTLFELLSGYESEEDSYGAAAVILEKYPDELLRQCEILINDPARKKDFKKIIPLFGLRQAINRSPVVGKTYAQIQSDFERWKKISEAAQ